jgi:hypothetical protein
MKPQKTTPIPRGFLIFLAACALPSFPKAEINLRREIAQVTEPWADRFAEGTRVASVVAQTGSQAIAVEFGSNNYIAQSVAGNDQYLKGIAFHGGGLNPVPSEYIVSVLDYGMSAPVMSLQEFNPSQPPVVMTCGTITLGREGASKVYISFTGEDSVLLKKDRAYVIIIGATRDSKASFYRAISDEGYPQGTGATGPLRLNPNAFSANGSRDMLFALYTAPAANLSRSEQ